jgi:mannose-1-phosphate guanylyltransferase
MEHLDLHLVVIAGGSGTRFWPKSTSKRPKQLLSFGQSSSLLAQTVSRFDRLVPQQQRIIVTTQFLQGAIQSEKLHVEILAEPQGRNTAPCVYWAARYVAQKNPKGVMLIMPSDHYIADSRKFIDAVQAAARWANEKDDLVTLGIQPSRPETGYGYLKTGPSLDPKGNAAVKKVEAFVEKPNLDKAKEFVQSGRYLWNGGMFLWRAEVILKAFDQFMPEMKSAWEKANGKVEEAYPQMTATSIDYGIMEKAQNVVTFPLDCGWDDLGNWTSLDSLADALQARQGTNVITAGELLAVDSSRNVIDAPKRLVALLGVDDLIVVENGDAILVAKKDRAQDIRKVVDEVKKRRPDLA